MIRIYPHLIYEDSVPCNSMGGKLKEAPEVIVVPVSFFSPLPTSAANKDTDTLRKVGKLIYDFISFPMFCIFGTMEVLKGWEKNGEPCL